MPIVPSPVEAAPPRLAAPPPPEIAARIAELRARPDAMADGIDPEDFGSWDEVAEFLDGHASAEPVALGPDDLHPGAAAPVLMRQAKARNKSTVSTRGHDRAVARARPGPAAPVRVRPGMAHLVRPGVSLGPPRRLIVRLHRPTSIDVSEAKFRRQARGLGKCVGEQLAQVRRAYALAYALCTAARSEIAAMQRQPENIEILWHASLRLERAAPAYWFGEDYEKRTIQNVALDVGEILRNWERAFIAGFRGHLPVFIRCKSVAPLFGDPPARHIAKNTIELMPSYFQLTPAKQAITLLHEMGHHSTAALRPRDERHRLCVGGWNRKENICYRDNAEVSTFGQTFFSSNPRRLAIAATEGDGSARKTALNNVDNYVCYMWNRFADHGEDMLEVLPPGAKPARPSGTGKPTGHGKPVG